MALMTHNEIITLTTKHASRSLAVPVKDWDDLAAAALLLYADRRSSEIILAAIRPWLQALLASYEGLHAQHSNDDEDPSATSEMIAEVREFITWIKEREHGTDSDAGGVCAGEVPSVPF